MRSMKAISISMMIGMVGFFSFLPSVLADKPTQFYTTVTKTDTATSTTTAKALWTPASGNRFILQGCFVSSTEAVDVQLQVGSTNVIPPIHMESPGSHLVHSGGVPIYISNVNDVLTWTTSSLGRTPTNTHGSVSIMVWGWEDGSF